MCNDKKSTVTDKDPKRIAGMFDRIAGRYDLLNRTLSFRRDVAWRKKMAKAVPNGSGLRVLDVATGTADVILQLTRGNDRIAYGLGIDIAVNMLDVGRKKIQDANLDDRLLLTCAEAHNIPTQDESFDLVTVAFGIRNMPDIEGALAEMRRVLKPHGRILVLEFSIPQNRLFKELYLFYFRNVLPRIGALISGDSQAYGYLNSSVEIFPHGEKFCKIMRSAGFQNTKPTPLTFGISTLYQAEK